MLTPPYDYTPIIERAPITWPGDKRVAFYIGLNIEHFHLARPPPASSRPPAPWSRTRVVDHYPQIVDAGMSRGWAWLAHGRTNSILHSGLTPDAGAPSCERSWR